jgi:uncharacterized membrane protein HdeD (DUF308 family)
MLHTLERNWWLLALRGVAAIVFGVLALLWPGLTLVALVLLWGAFAVADGIAALVAAIRGGAFAPRWWLALVGIAGIVVGTLTLLWPRITGLVLLWFIAGWAVAVGAMQIVGAIRLRKEISNEWLLIAGGILSLLFGIVLFWRPGAGALGLAFAIGVFAIVYGVLLVSLALRLHRHEQTHGHGHAHA